MTWKFMGIVNLTMGWTENEEDLLEDIQDLWQCQKCQSLALSDLEPGRCAVCQLSAIVGNEIYGPDPE